MRYRTSARAISVVLFASGPATTVTAQDVAPNANTATLICLAPVTVEATPAGMDPVAAVRDAFTSFLTGPTLGVQPLTARLQSQVREEAKLAGCPFLLLPSIKHERKTGGGGGLLGKVAGAAVQQGAWAVAGSAGSTAERVVAGAAAGVASTAVSGYASGSQQSDELTISYRLESADGKVLLKKSEKQKAKSAGEDVLTPVVQRAAEAIAETATKTKGQ